MNCGLIERNPLKRTEAESNALPVHLNGLSSHEPALLSARRGKASVETPRIRLLETGASFEIVVLG